MSSEACGPHQASKMVSWCEIEHYPPVAFIEDIPIPNLYLDGAADLLLGVRLGCKMIQHHLRRGTLDNKHTLNTAIFQ